MDIKTSSAGNENRLERVLKKFLGSTIGCCGAIYIDDTATHVGPFMAIQVVGTVDAVMDQSAMAPCAGHLAYTDFNTDITIPKGGIIYGKFNCIALVSGSVLAYKTS